MSNFEKVEYWLELADDDLDTAKWCLKGDKLLHCGHLCHLVVEKALKAVVTDVTKEISPKIHDLPRLANIGNIYDDLTQGEVTFLQELNTLQVEARYPE
ncbi:MAG: HEPN domain-containing protein, partial [Oscillospiraceae bacterium]|nr:HEPN domain-containing protein [Oscillospiraceae bacterium]